ncbi:MAG TPA: long-chain fatty acid--CoA ligase [Panacibacter sp.]|nr:long-chain fatty acid--CoA ligase [Panacibacter sp.]
MNKPSRLFDCIEYQIEKFGDKDMLAAKENGTWKIYSTNQVKQIVNRFSAGLMSLGVSGNDMSEEGSDKIAIVSNNRPEWLFTDMAVQQTGAVLVPIYPTTNANELQFILNDAQVKYIFVSNKDLLDKIKSISLYVPSLKNIYSFDKIEGVDHWSQITDMATGTAIYELEDIKASISEENLATIIYTSGTTGTPKGVMLTHKNIVSNLMDGKESFPFPDAPHYKALSFLPLNHIFEKNVSYIYMFSCIAIYYAESLETIGDNMREVKPDMFTTVPRLLEKVFERIMSKGNELTGFKRKLFFWSVALAEKYDNNISGGFLYNAKLGIADKLIFSKWREALGGNVKCIITGGAACQEKLLRIFNAAKIPVYEGYGPTENSPVICVNRQPPGSMKFGTVGPPINKIEIKLAGDGEIMVKGPSVMRGYYKRPDLTAETIVDGWLLTGDIGVWDGDCLKITDRKKELFKTSGGKYVAPQPIENKLKESMYIEQVIVVGADRKFVGALIVPSFANLKVWMQQQGLNSTSPEEDCRNPKILELFKNIVEEMNAGINHVEQIKKFELLPREWSIESGEMTPKMSLKRKIIMEKYKDAIDRIYA